MYHGIIVDQEFSDSAFCKSFKIFNKKQSGTWILYGIEVDNRQIEDAIKKIQENMKVNQPWYAHFYNDQILIVVFKEKVFRATSHISTWGPIMEFGRKLNIPVEQLDFWPNRFQDEKHYFQKEEQ
jgi:hypothetical protein